MWRDVSLGGVLKGIGIEASRLRKRTAFGLQRNALLAIIATLWLYWCVK